MEALWDRGYRQLSTGEGRKVLLLRAVLAQPSLLVLDDPFDGLDLASHAELAAAIIHIAATLPVLVVGAFRASRAPFALDTLHDVTVIEHQRITFRGTPQQWLAHETTNQQPHRAPPVHLGTFYQPLDPAVPLVELKRGRVQYGDHVVFEQLDFTVQPGQHTLIEGPNGRASHAARDDHRDIRRPTATTFI